VVDDPITRTPEGPRDIGVLDRVSGRPPGERLEPSMTIPEGFGTRLLSRHLEQEATYRLDC